MAHANDSSPLQDKFKVEVETCLHMTCLNQIFQVSNWHGQTNRAEKLTCECSKTIWKKVLLVKRDSFLIYA